MAVSCHKESVRQDTPVGNWVVYSILKNRLYNVGFQEKGKMTLSGDNITFLLTADTTDKSGGHPMEID